MTAEVDNMTAELDDLQLFLVQSALLGWFRGLLSAKVLIL